VDRSTSNVETDRLTGGLSEQGGSLLTDETSQTQTSGDNMKLFAVRLPNGSLVVSERTGEPVYYDDKKEAKRVRDRHDGSCIVLGPDHARYDDN